MRLNAGSEEKRTSDVGEFGEVLTAALVGISVPAGWREDRVCEPRDER
jgi:hypothetical protein